MLNPKSIDDHRTLAHFFKFEQVYCQRRIKKIDDINYAYSGYPINFNENGISQMRLNPTSENITPDSTCYTESRIFHLAYRNFLRQLQEAFNGKHNSKSGGNDFFATVELMKTLQNHAKRLMTIEFNPEDHTTCGPVWNYEWKGE